MTQAKDGGAWTTAAFEARCLLGTARAASLATQQDGQPFASLVTPASLPDGSVLLLLSALSAHTRHLTAEPRCALLICAAADGPNPQTTPRLTLTGRAALTADPALRRIWLARHPYAAFYADLPDFAVWQVTPVAGHLVGGFARATALHPAELAPDAAALRAVGDAQAGILAQFDPARMAAICLLAAHGTGGWRVQAADPDGLDLVRGHEVVRIPFDAPVADAAGLRAALGRLADRAHGLVGKHAGARPAGA